MNPQIQRAIEAQLGVQIAHASPISGGCINEAFRCHLRDGREFFVKYQHGAPHALFSLEAEGLAWLAEAQALPVPNVLCHGPEFLVLEHIPPGEQARDFDEQLGRGLAQLHAFQAPFFGWQTNNYLATIQQNNSQEKHWTAFYCDRRLRPLLERCIQMGHVPPNWNRRFDTLFGRMDEFAGPPEPPARLHGDLWSGNVHTNRAGAPVLIDPAVYGGHREVDLAMLELFGSPSAAFYAAYDEVYPRSVGQAQRVSLYQLYPLLAHIVLFGSSYVERCQRALTPWC
jgi:fructosamine-3-kinase